MNTNPGFIYTLIGLHITYIKGVHKVSMLYFFKKTNSFIDDEAFIFTREESPRSTESTSTKNRDEKLFSRIMIIQDTVTRFGFNMLNNH